MKFVVKFLAAVRSWRHGHWPNHGGYP